jgi:hypothetical protein
MQQENKKQYSSSYLTSRLVKILFALAFMLLHGYFALIVLGESLVNEPHGAITTRAIFVSTSLGAACVMSLLIVIGALMGWKNRTIGTFALFITLAWLILLFSI